MSDEPKLKSRSMVNKPRRHMPRMEREDYNALIVIRDEAIAAVRRAWADAPGNAAELDTWLNTIHLLNLIVGTYDRRPRGANMGDFATVMRGLLVDTGMIGEQAPTPALPPTLLVEPDDTPLCVHGLPEPCGSDHGSLEHE